MKISISISANGEIGVKRESGGSARLSVIGSGEAESYLAKAHRRLIS